MRRAQCRRHDGHRRARRYACGLDDQSSSVSSRNIYALLKHTFRSIRVVLLLACWRFA